jgi:hypothetical protein
MDQFAIGLFEIGDCSLCLLSFLCPNVALGYARTALDGSDCLFNVVCMNPMALRWLVRSAYGIGDTSLFCEDLVLSSVCSCCVINQLVQTTRAYGRPEECHNVGQLHNNTAFQNRNMNCLVFLAAYCCAPIMMGKVMRDALGMPCPLGCLCVSPFAGRNILRYHYRIAPYTYNDISEELLAPAGIYGVLNACKAAPATITALFNVLDALIITQLESEIAARRAGHHGYHLHASQRYLHYQPQHTVVQLTVPSMPTYFTHQQTNLPAHQNVHQYEIVNNGGEESYYQQQMQPIPEYVSIN